MSLKRLWTPILDMPPKIEVAVYMPDAEARQFLLFKKHFDVFEVLVAANVFDQKNASITLNFDNHGILQVVERKDRLYSRRHSLST